MRQATPLLSLALMSSPLLTLSSARLAVNVVVFFGSFGGFDETFGGDLPDEYPELEVVEEGGDADIAHGGDALTPADVPASSTGQGEVIPDPEMVRLQRQQDDNASTSSEELVWA